jgi:hypothetical protein
VRPSDEGPAAQPGAAAAPDSEEEREVMSGYGPGTGLWLLVEGRCALPRAGTGSRKRGSCSKVLSPRRISGGGERQEGARLRLEPVLFLSGSETAAPTDLRTRVGGRGGHRFNWPICGGVARLGDQVRSMATGTALRIGRPHSCFTWNTCLWSREQEGEAVAQLAGTAARPAVRAEESPDLGWTEMGTELQMGSMRGTGAAARQ